MPTFLNDSQTTSLFMFNHIIARFGVPYAIMADHGTHFRNHMMTRLSSNLLFNHDNSYPYYPQVNGQVETINKVLKTMIQWYETQYYPGKPSWGRKPSKTSLL